MFQLTRYEGNPVLSPNPANDWENLAVCNPGVWYEDATYFLLYRAAGDDALHQVKFGLATSHDGVTFKRHSDDPVFTPEPDGFGPSSGCVEDPRIVKFGDAFFITYAYRPFPPGRYWEFAYDEVLEYPTPAGAPLNLKTNLANSGLLMSSDLMSFRRLGRITKSYLDDRDVILFPEKVNGKYVMLHRPKEWVGQKYGVEEPSVWITFSDDLTQWDEPSQLLLRGERPWEKKVGGSTPPIRTDAGWLMLYHGVDDAMIYRVGAALLDLDDPTRVIARLPYFILEPARPYETEGLYHGCVFPTGGVVVDGILDVYYGGADTYCCMASGELNSLLDELKRFSC